MMKKLKKTLVLAMTLLSFTMALAACEKEGPAEQAGEKMDEAVEKAGDKVEEATD